ncbi:alpha/beta fold hydrolase [Actinocorallia populi]|uniref:alpha/beta fold hydrolase n=1 Tax=Actinocorallia populi TaxID=2079200 RepID=UPI000D0972A2|nr:alpha/beta hydrolase [Actinocorallia populi]
MTEIVRACDGRALAVEEFGRPDGSPVFVLHGMPGSRLGPFPKPSLLYQLGVRLIAYDRPGYGESDRHPGRNVADAAQDVARIADALGIERFAVLGRSGGGPHALACAALLPGRVTRVAVLVGLAESTGPSESWTEPMNGFNRRAYRAAESGAGAVKAKLETERYRSDPALIVQELYEELTESDRRVVDDAGIRSELIRSYTEGIRLSADGWVDDMLAFVIPWGFKQTDIIAPTLIWHGADDRFSPVGHARALAENIPDCRVLIQPGRGHFSAFKVMPDVISMLTDDHRGWNSISPSMRRWALA